MFYCRFFMMRNKRYQCSKIKLHDEKHLNYLERQNYYGWATITKELWLVCSKKPRLGFCKRPHKYL
jgi:hypothetical protein